MLRWAPVILILLGLLTIVGTYVGFVLVWNEGMNKGAGVTVPSAVDIDLGADQPEHAVWRELMGPHVTINQPLLGVPDDLEVVVTDRRTGEALALEDGGLRTSQQILPGLVRDRRTIVYFTPPAHGEIRVDISGTFEYPQPYRVAPGMRELAVHAKRYMLIGPLAGGIAVLLGLGVFVARAVRAESKLEIPR